MVCIIISVIINPDVTTSGGSSRIGSLARY